MTWFGSVGWRMALQFPDLPPGALRSLLVALHELHDRAGAPGMRAIGAAVGCSHHKVHQMFTSGRLPADGDTLFAIAGWLARQGRRPRVESEADETQFFDWFEELWREAKHATLLADPEHADRGKANSGRRSVSRPKPAAVIEPVRAKLEAVVKAGEAPASRGSVAWSPRGDVLAVTSPGGVVQLRDWMTGKPVRTLSPRSLTLRTPPAFSSDGEYISIVGNHSISICHAANGAELIAFPGNDARWSPRQPLLAAISSDLDTVILCDPFGPPTRLLVGRHGRVWDVAFSPDGEQLAANGYLNAVEVFEVNSGKLLRTLTGTPGRILSVAWTPGARIATQSDNGVMRSWNPNGHKFTLAATSHRSRIWWMGWSPDGHFLASHGTDAQLKIWDTRTTVAHSIGVTETSGLLRAWSPNDSRLAFLTAGRAKVFDATTSQTIAGDIFQAPVDLAWSPDGSRIAVLDAESKVHILDSATLDGIGVR